MWRLLVTSMENLGAMATVSGAISCPVLSNFASVVTSKYGRVIAYQTLKTIEKFKSPALKVLCGHLQEVIAYDRFQV